MTIIVKFTIATNIACSEVSDVMEFDDGVTEEEIRESWIEWVWENVDGGYCKEE